MRVTASSESIAAALKHSVASRNSTMPVLTHVLLQAEGNTLRLQTSDTEIYVSHDIAANVQQAGSICLSEAKLRAVCSGEGDVTLGADGHAVRGRSRFTIETLAAENFPRPEEALFDPIPLEPEALLAAMNAVAYAADDGDVRPLCRVVHIEPGKAWSTNGHMLARCAINYTGPSLRIPEAQAKRLAAMMALPGVQLQVAGSSATTANMLQAKAEHASLILRCMDAPGTSIDQAFPLLDKRIRIVIDRKELIAALRRIRPFLASPKVPVVALEFSGDGISLVSNDSGSVEFIAAEGSREDVPRTGVNPDYLMMILGALDSGVVELYPPAEVNSGPLVVLPEGGDIDVLAHVVMPCRV
jgi:DNA polymerase-3 subunit beta